MSIQECIINKLRESHRLNEAKIGDRKKIIVNDQGMVEGPSTIFPGFNEKVRRSKYPHVAEDTSLASYDKLFKYIVGNASADAKYLAHYLNTCGVSFRNWVPDHREGKNYAITVSAKDMFGNKIYLCIK